MSLKVLITGASSGIGKQLATDYAKEGAQVIACGRNQQALHELQQIAPNITPLAFDVTNTDDTKKALQCLPFEPELWILNAGVCEYIDNGIIDSDLISRVMAVNFQGVVNCIEGIQPLLRAGNRVAIVSSIAGELAMPRAEAYGASKVAITYLARALRVAWRPSHVDISVVYPGFVATPLTAQNTFSMPMMISAQQASLGIRKGLAKGKPHIYVPRVFTTMIRLIALLPYSWQQRLMKNLIREQGSNK
ncbi:SDR family NAD(P)-dependent oxidoreductase [Vibrio sp. CAIM 722]|uniref:SDR family NAD(P)-dependent oxidoreductase n=1 Tax=Vibrio eleionomae TaxID=2653505 RepID=A0A7X4LN97_9VIBR|nr:SDR family NAD(P)-dependent oxidoreductase [Vibrio eleionomae]MZI95103.1 SDR family NAD(P)-dependent oxidoreductase [Vibrio eleionomae]